MLLLPLCIAAYGQSGHPAGEQPVQTSLQQAANCVVTEFVDDGSAPAGEPNNKMNDLMKSFLMVGLLPNDPGVLGDEYPEDDDENAARRTNRDRRRRDNQRRKNNRDRRQRNDDNRRTQNRYRRTNQRRVEETT